MAVFAAAFFFVSLGGIAALFVLKFREAAAGAAIVPETLREAGDERALELKDRLRQMRERIATVPPRFVRASRIVLHDAALGVAALARGLERLAHSLADRVSHKHHFERRETSNDFLRQVSGFRDEHVATATPEDAGVEAERFHS